jgi:aldose sugar dehydrogenase
MRYRPMRIAPRDALAATLVVLSLALSAVADARVVESEKHDFRVVTLAEGLEHPWGLAFLPDGAMLITERPGRLRMFRDGALLPTPVAGVPEVAAIGQGGLLDVTLHPDFAENGVLFLTQAAGSGSGAWTRVVRARLADDRLEDVQTIFDAEPRTHRGGRHFGSRVRVAPDGYLYVSVGDRGTMDDAQRVDRHAGSIVRIDERGGVPPDNPLAGREDALPEIYSWGHRNPQGMAVHPETGAVWIHEHGPRGGDEINVPRPGLNFGWPLATHGTGYDGSRIGDPPPVPGMEPPIHHWTPSIAPSGMDFYTGDAFPAWRGNLFSGGLAIRVLSRIELDGDEVVHEEWLLRDAVGRIREVRNGPDGYIYLLTDAPDGALLRLEPAD